jgi:hypothetical protein
MQEPAARIAAGQNSPTGLIQPPRRDLCPDEKGLSASASGMRRISGETEMMEVGLGVLLTRLEFGPYRRHTANVFWICPWEDARDTDILARHAVARIPGFDCGTRHGMATRPAD